LRLTQIWAKKTVFVQARFNYKPIGSVGEMGFKPMDIDPRSPIKTYPPCLSTEETTCNTLEDLPS